MKTALMIAALVTALVLLGCARPDPRNVRVRLPQVHDESETIVACPDDGVHIAVAGHCVDTDHPEK